MMGADWDAYLVQGTVVNSGDLHRLVKKLSPKLREHLDSATDIEINETLTNWLCSGEQIPLLGGFMLERIQDALGEAKIYLYTKKVTVTELQPTETVGLLTASEIGQFNEFLRVTSLPGQVGQHLILYVSF